MLPVHAAAWRYYSGNASAANAGHAIGHASASSGVLLPNADLIYANVYLVAPRGAGAGTSFDL